jgi:hypothetical protein
LGEAALACNCLRVEAGPVVGHGVASFLRTDMTDMPISGTEPPQDPPHEPTEADRAKLATRLLAALYERFWTQGDLAWEAGLSASRIARFCHGTEWPDAESLARLAAALGLPLGGLDPVPDPDAPQHKGRPRKTGKILSFSKRRR